MSKEGYSTQVLHSASRTFKPFNHVVCFKQVIHIDVEGSLIDAGFSYFSPFWGDNNLESTYVRKSQTK